MRIRRRFLAYGTLALIIVASGLFAAPGFAYPGPTVELEGHGWGHGRGMGQYGALGYALDHGWNFQQILAHYYGGTTGGSIPDSPIRVRLTRFDNLATYVQQEKGHLVTTAAGGTYSALRTIPLGGNSFRLEQAPSCGGGWTTVVGSVSGPITFSPQINNEDRTEMLQVCEPQITGQFVFRWLRGNVIALNDAGLTRTVNDLGIEGYLKGVVPRESPSSWGNLGGGAGMHALRAQAVAARSYGRSENRYPYAHTCDTTSCQVYGGRAVQDSAGFRDLEHALTSQAVDETAGQVRTIAGVPARTEFSSSTGGWSAGGTFPPVPDEGDDVSLNPNHYWRASIPVGTVEAAWPEIGSLQNLVVTKRNGLGDFGGRVLEVRLEGSSGTATASGSSFRSRLGLKSDWFRILGGRGWEYLGGSVIGGPDASSWGPERIDIFARGVDNNLWHKWWAPGWFGWENLGAPSTSAGVGITSDPGASSWAEGRVDIFGRGTDGSLWHKYWENGWSGWEGLGGGLIGGPDVASWGPGRLDIFVRGLDNQLWHMFWDGSWSSWESLGGVLTSDPSVTSWASGRLDIFVRGSDMQLWRITWDGAWSAWEGLGGILASAPDASSWTAGRIDVVVSGTDDQLWHKHYAGAWSEWEGLGAPAGPAGIGVASDPSGVSWSSDRLDLFVRGREGSIWHRYWDGTRWSE